MKTELESITFYSLRALRARKLLFLIRENKIDIFKPNCNIFKEGMKGKIVDPP